MKYLVWDSKTVTYRVQDERARLYHTVAMPRRPKAGQFWRHKNMEQYTFISSTTCCSEKYDEGAHFRAVACFDLNYTQSFDKACGQSLFSFLQMYEPVTDQGFIHDVLIPEVLKRCSTFKKAKRILSLKELGLCEEDRNILLLRYLDK